MAQGAQNYAARPITRVHEVASGASEATVGHTYASLLSLSRTEFIHKLKEVNSSIFRVFASLSDYPQKALDLSLKGVFLNTTIRMTSMQVHESVRSRLWFRLPRAALAVSEAHIEV